ncbi:MAG: demethoxyubiquinone hydroxylase family protein [Alphaproteobacteria bacterium]|nr:demethoxyubiquinone hydroxylase family protein [Alphaproteobacteria bacterium]MBV9372990.1 demethoxyubiquinone hydroxylase family protein [Alphaproteobacteria bacterium]MBV9901357.1 demethoxyubiquinone hydroxylase family protein [Alphaproteobacteria bacterium]
MTVADPAPAPAAPAWRPGDERADVASMIRVDQAGEYGATRIYCGQLEVLGARHPAARVIARMQGQEERHLKTFDAMMVERGVRPTLLQPVWNVAGHALGAVTALMGPSAAMACTAAVETEIDKHYGQQVQALGAEEGDLAATITRFQREELEHRDTAIESGAESAFGYPVLSAFIRAGCRLAIALSKRI